MEKDSKYIKRCAWCNKSFESSNKNQKYCSKRCCKNANRNYEDIPESKRAKGNVIRTFYCRNCKKFVLVTDPKDRRTVFCSNKCQIKYWKNEGLNRTKLKKTNSVLNN